MNKQYLKPFFIRLIPLFCVCSMLLIDNFSVRFFGFSQSFITNALGFIFCFAVFRITAFNSILLFLLGILTDIILVFPLGFSSLIFCFVFFVAQFNRRYLFFNGNGGLSVRNVVFKSFSRLNSASFLFDGRIYRSFVIVSVYCRFLRLVE